MLPISLIMIPSMLSDINLINFIKQKNIQDLLIFSNTNLTSDQNNVVLDLKKDFNVYPYFNNCNGSIHNFNFDFTNFFIDVTTCNVVSYQTKNYFLITQDEKISADIYYYNVLTSNLFINYPYTFYTSYVLTNKYNNVEHIAFFKYANINPLILDMSYEELQIFFNNVQIIKNRFLPKTF